MQSWEEDALEAIRATWGELVLYTGAGLAEAELIAIPAQDDAPSFHGAGQSLRKQVWEVKQADLPDAPANGNLIQEVVRGWKWRVIDISRLDDVGAWQFVTERAE